VGEARTAELSQRLTKLRQSKAQETARSIGAALSPLVIAAAVATAGFWTYQLIWSAPQPVLAITSDATADAETKLKAAEIEQQRLQEEVQGQAKAATELQTKLQAAQAEQQRLAKAATDADSKRGAAEAELQRLKDEVQRQTKAAANAEANLKASAPQAATTIAKLPFEIRPNTEARYIIGPGVISSERVPSIGECEASCARSPTCKIFSYRRDDQMCYSYSDATLAPNAKFDSGVRNSATPP